MIPSRGFVPARTLAAALILGNLLAHGLTSGGAMNDTPIEVETGTRLQAPGTYVTPEMTLKLARGQDDMWTVAVIGEGRRGFSASHGSRFSNWFGYVSGPRTAWFHSGDVGTKRLTVRDDGSVSFEGMPREDSARRAFVGSMPDGFFELLPDSAKRTFRPYWPATP